MIIYSKPEQALACSGGFVLRGDGHDTAGFCTAVLGSDGNLHLFGCNHFLGLQLSVGINGGISAALGDLPAEFLSGGIVGGIGDQLRQIQALAARYRLVRRGQLGDPPLTFCLLPSLAVAVMVTVPVL